MSSSTSIRKYISSFIGKRIGTITQVMTRENVIALTFDDGPHPEFTPHLLKILEKHQAKATFFLIGRSVQRYPNILLETAKAGHAIGLHGWDHTSFVKINARERREQILSSARITDPYALRIFRPPFGHQSLASHLDVRRLGYEIIGWSLHAADWLHREGSSIATDLAAGIKPGSIILLHDAIYLPTVEVNQNRHATLEAVDLLLDRLGSKMKFVTVPELLKSGNPIRENWYRNEEQ